MPRRDRFETVRPCSRLLERIPDSRLREGSPKAPQNILSTRQVAKTINLTLSFAQRCGGAWRAPSHAHRRGTRFSARTARRSRSARARQTLNRSEPLASVQYATHPVIARRRGYRCGPPCGGLITTPLVSRSRETHLVIVDRIAQDPLIFQPRKRPRLFRPARPFARSSDGGDHGRGWRATDASESHPASNRNPAAFRHSDNAFSVRYSRICDRFIRASVPLCRQAARRGTRRASIGLVKGNRRFLVLPGRKINGGMREAGEQARAAFTQLRGKKGGAHRISAYFRARMREARLHEWLADPCRKSATRGAGRKMGSGRGGI